MAHSHEFDCRQCGAHLDSGEALDRHNREEHTAQAGSSKRSAPVDDSSRGDSSRGDSSLSGLSRNDPDADDETLL